MKLLQNTLTLVIAMCIAIAMPLVDASIYSEYIIITDSTISAEIALNQAVESTGATLRRANRPQVKRVVDIHEDDDDENEISSSQMNRKAKKSKQYGLVSSLSEADHTALRSIPGVVDIVPNVPIELAIMDTSILDAERQLITVAKAGGADASAAESTTQWNLDRVDQPFGRDGKYVPANEDGSNVDMYIIDTGVKADHEAFGGRVQPGKNALETDADLPGNDDCHSHGTHVASTAAGDIYGIARGATIFPVKILDCAGRGSLMGMVAGVDWVKAKIAARGSSRKAVVNLSIQSSANDIIDQLVKILHNAGAVVVVAAANFNSDACFYSPAREPVAVTVGATSEDDSKLSSSNFGRCVDIYAPGDNIVGAGIWNGVSGTATKRGTSMASPLVAGIAATLRQKYPEYTNVRIIEELLKIASPLPKLIGDFDCAGNVTGQKFAQTLTASTRPETLNDAQVALGQRLQGQFLWWSPENSLKPSADDEICFSFKAQVTSARAAIGAAGIRFAVATAALPTGIINFMETSYNCKDNTVRWWVMDSAGEDARNPTSKIWDTEGKVIRGVARAAVGELSLTSASQFYASIKMTGRGLSIEFGSGDGTSDRTRFLLASIVDEKYKGSLSAIKRLSFSSNDNYDISYTEIQPCSGVVDVIPTPSPTVPKASGGAAPPANLNIPRTRRGKYVQWPAGWSKPSAAESSCFQFRLPMSRSAGRLFISLATNALGQGKVNTVPKAGEHAHVLVVTRNTVQLLRDGKSINMQYIVPSITVPKRGSKPYIFKAEAKPDGTITLKMQVPGSSEWTNLYEYVDPSAGFFGTRFSVSSSTVRKFTQIAVCDTGAI